MKNILPEIIRRAELVLAEGNQIPADTRCSKAQALDRLFSKNPFGCQQNTVIELVELIVPGYTRTVPTTQKAKMFSVFIDQPLNVPAIILNDEMGAFATLEHDRRHFDSAVEPIAEYAAARAYIESLKYINPVEFGKWLIQQSILLPDDLMAL